MKTLRILKNRLLLLIGFRLLNTRGRTLIHYQNGLYIVTGKHKFGTSEARFHHCPYSMDDHNWEIYS